MVQTPLLQIEMDTAIASKDWFEVGELLKQELIDGQCTTDIQKLNRFIHYIDPEILALHYMCSQLSKADRGKIGNTLQKLTEINPQANDILNATNLYYRTLEGDEEAENQALELIQSTTSNAARFISYLALIDTALRHETAEQALTVTKSLLGVYRKSRMQWMDRFIQQYITPAFVLSLRLPYLDLSIFSDVTNFIEGDAGRVYQQLKDVNSFKQTVRIAAKLQDGREVTASPEAVAHHGRVARLQTHLLMLPQQQRVSMEYGALIEVLGFQTEEELEQIFIELTLLGIIDSEIDTLNKTITVTHVKALSGSQEIRQILVQRLEEWISKVTACKELFASVVDNEQDD